MARQKRIKPVRLTMIGALGRMGTQILNLAKNDPRFQIMAGVEKADSPELGRFITGAQAPIVGSIDEVAYKTDVFIDFTAPEVVLKNAERVARAKKALVVGTTGLKPAGIKRLKALSRRIPIVFSPNMSVGVNLLFKLVEKAAKTLGHYDIEIVEAHHSLKKDAPSGTAMKLAEIAAESSDRSSRDFIYGRKGITGARKKKQIGISAVRAGDIVGDHTVLLSNSGERLELVHRAHSRNAFASGALTAAVWIAKKRPGLYNMHNVLGLK